MAMMIPIILEGEGRKGRMAGMPTELEPTAESALQMVPESGATRLASLAQKDVAKPEKLEKDKRTGPQGPGKGNPKHGSGSGKGKP